MPLSNKVVWALDPLSKNFEKAMVAEKVLSNLQKKQSFRVLPLSIITPDDLNLPLNLVAPWGEKLQELSEKAVKPFLNSLSLKGLLKPEVIMSTKKTAIDDFVKYSSQQNASLIVVATHEKRGVEKNRIGQFTQHLIEKSVVPVLAVNPNTKIPNSVRKILFPTDFSEYSGIAFKKLLKLAQQLKAEIVLYHNISEPVLPAAEMTGIAISSSEFLVKYVKEWETEQKNRSNRWIRTGHRQGVQVTYTRERGDFSLGGNILRTAQKEKVQLVALGIESHPNLRSVFGSTVHEVITSAEQPVLIINSHTKSKTSSKGKL